MSPAPDDGKHWLEPPDWWKKSKPLRWVPILIGLAIVLPGLWVAKETIAPSAHPETSKFLEVAGDPVNLLDAYRSYDTLERARAQLDKAQVQYTVARVCPARHSKYPPRDTASVVAPEYKHLGVKGQLTMEFFNDRLYEATFVPKDVYEYVDKLHAADKRLRRDKTGRSEVVVGHLRIASNVDFAATDTGWNLATKPFVIWQDTRLVNQLDDWDKRFIARPGTCS